MSAFDADGDIKGGRMFAALTILGLATVVVAVWASGSFEFSDGLVALAITLVLWPFIGAFVYILMGVVATVFGAITTWMHGGDPGEWFRT